ncbi:MAG: NADH-quinone oxidoreductase subunit H [Desulfuromonadales bacterium]
MPVTENPLFQLLIFPGGLFALAFGLLLKGLDRKVTVRLQRGVGPALIQPFIDLLKLSYRGLPLQITAQGVIFTAALLLGVSAIALVSVPVLNAGIYGGGQVVISLPAIFGLFAVPSLALLVGELLSGGHFTAVRFSRERVLLQIWAGALLLVLLGVALRVGLGSGETVALSLEEIVRFQQKQGPLLWDPVLLPAFLTYLFFIPAICGEGPFALSTAEAEFAEGPTHEFTKPLLALFQVMSALRTMAALALGVALFFPPDLGTTLLLGLFCFILKCTLMMLVSLPLMRSQNGYFRLDQLVRLFWKWPAALGLLSLILVFITGSCP